MALVDYKAEDWIGYDLAKDVDGKEIEGLDWVILTSKSKDKMPFTDLALTEGRPCPLDDDFVPRETIETTDRTSWFIKDKFVKECEEIELLWTPLGDDIEAMIKNKVQISEYNFLQDNGVIELLDQKYLEFQRDAQELEDYKTEKKANMLQLWVRTIEEYGLECQARLANR